MGVCFVSVCACVVVLVYEWLLCDCAYGCIQVFVLWVFSYVWLSLYMSGCLLCDCAYGCISVFVL